MPVIRATVRLRHVNLLPEDEVVNVWHFQSLAALDAPTSTKLALGLQEFYRPIYAHLSGTMLRQVALAGIVQTSTVTPGAAGPEDDVASRLFMSHTIPLTTAFPATTGANLPGEVAAVLSFAGDIEGIPEESGATRPAARRRGRIFLGRLSTTTSTAGLTTASTVTPRLNRGNGFFTDVVMDSYETMVTSLSAAPNALLHIVYSPTSAAMHVVTSISMDDAFDTIRSRGEAASVRDTRPVDWGTL